MQTKGHFTVSTGQLNQCTVPEGLVDWPIPADKRHRGKEDEPEDGQTKVNTILRVCSEKSQAGQHIEEESGTVDWRDMIIIARRIPTLSMLISQMGHSPHEQPRYVKYIFPVPVSC